MSTQAKTEAGERTQRITGQAILQTHLDNLERDRQNLRRLGEAADLAAVITEQFPQLFPDVMVCPSLPSIIVRLNGITNLKDEIEPVATLVLKAGFRPERWYDEPEFGRRTYVYHNADRIDFTLFAQLDTSSGAACSFKQVGVKECPIYELVCEGGEG